MPPLCDLASLTDLIHAIESFEPTDDSSNGPQTTADFTLEDLLAPAAIESYSKGEDQPAQLSGDSTSIDPSSSPLSTTISDVGAFLDWSVASRYQTQGGTLEMGDTKNSLMPSGSHSRLQVPARKTRSPGKSSHRQPSTGKFAGQFITTGDKGAQLRPNPGLRMQQKKGLVSTGPTSLIEGWIPSDGSCKMVDLHIPDREDVPRSALADITVSWVNQAVPVYGGPLRSDVPQPPKFKISGEEFPTVAVRSELPDVSKRHSANVARSRAYAPRTAHKRLSAPRTAVPVTSTAAETDTLSPNAILRFSAHGRPVGGVPPVLARTITSSMMAKERAKARAIQDAKGASLGLASSSNHITYMLPPSAASMEERATGHSRDKFRKISVDSTADVVHSMQGVSSDPDFDLPRARQDMARGHMQQQDPREDLQNITAGDQCFSIDDFTLTYHTVAMVDMDMRINMASAGYVEDVMQVEGSTSGSCAFSSHQHDQDETDETEASDMSYFWPISERVKMKRGSDVEHDCVNKRIRV